MGKSNMVFGDGKAWTNGINYGEMIRTDVDQTLSINTTGMRYLYQGVDPAAKTEYNALPWRLGLLTQDFLEPAIKGTTEILQAIQRITPSTVKRVILTSSYAAVGAFGRADERNKVYTEADWNPVTLEDAENDPGNKDVAYLASKKFAEQEAWNMQKGVDLWQLVTRNPPMVYGPLAHRITNIDGLNESNGLIWNAFLKEKKPDGEMPSTPFGLPLFIDVRDVAAAHVLAMDAANAGNQRFLISAGAADSQKIADILRAEVTGAEERVPKGEPGKNTLPDDAFSADNSKSLAVLGLRYRSAKETFADLGRQLLVMEKGV